MSHLKMSSQISVLIVCVCICVCVCVRRGDLPYNLNRLITRSGLESDEEGDAQSEASEPPIEKP